jgi:hypothetical protein
MRRAGTWVVFEAGKEQEPAGHAAYQAGTCRDITMETDI